ncbi:hypothetical protein SUGI_0851130 [Cryptomeria japonica]|nr:hypothetical protein SUGI_0851130 [Cryptomeria japonica]
MAYEPPDFYEFEVSPDLHAPSTTPGVQSPSPMTFNETVEQLLSQISSLTPPKWPDEETASLAANNLKTTILAAAVLSFVFLIAKDAHKAFMRRAHWIPCDFLVLSAFSIQLLSLLNAQNETLPFRPNKEMLSIKEGTTPTKGHPDARWKDILMIHYSRTTMSVFTAYVMPSMADRGLEHAWVRLAALVLTIFQHLSSQFYDAKSKIDVPKFLRLWPEENEKEGAEYYVYATIISLCFVLLILLLACATISVRSLELIVAEKISLVLRGEGEFCAGIGEKTEEAHPHPYAHHHSCWRKVRNDVNRADHSCLKAVEEAVPKEGKGDENQHHSCRRRNEDAKLSVEKEEENYHCCWRRVDDAAVRGEKAEEEHYRRHCHYCWRTVEDAVLKAWIIVRAYSVQPVLARSALTAAAAIILTIQIVTTVVGGLSKVLGVKPKDSENGWEIIATVAQCIFIFLGWSLVILRWATAVAYYPCFQQESWRNSLRVEDYWTRHLRNLQQASERRLQQAKLVDNKIDQLVSKELTGTVHSILLSAAIWLHWLLVSFSKACWLASLVIFRNKWMGKLFSFMFRKHILSVYKDYPKYRKILEDVEMLGESSESLWVAHRNSIEKAKSLIIQGNRDGKYNCEHLVDFLSAKKTDCGLGLRCLDPYKPQTGLNFLCKKFPIQATQQPPIETDVEKQQSRGREYEPLALDMSTKSWKMTAVSLLSIIVQLSPIYADLDKDQCSTSHSFPPGVVKDCLKAYSEAWEIIDFVEEADTEDDEITSEAADMYFQDLLMKVDKAGFPARSFRHATPECVRAALEELKKESKSKREPPESVNFIPAFVFALAVNGEKEKEQSRQNRSKGDDSIDWKTSASGSAVYNLCSSIECNDGADVSELLKELERCLADIINECLEKAQQLLLVTSRKWALKGDETRMGKALYTAGKAKAIMEKLVCNNVAIVCRR